MDKSISIKLGEAICEDLNLWGPDADKNTEKVQRIAAILRDHSTDKPRTEHDRITCDVAVMVSGRIADNAAYLRFVADKLEGGLISGRTGSASPCEGRWLSNLR